MASLRPMAGTDRPAVEALSWTPEQDAYVDPWDEVLPPARPDHDSFVIETADGIVGFLQIENGCAVCAIPGHLELHQVVIDRAHQGNGHAAVLGAPLDALVRDRYPGALGLCLTVNSRNARAHRAYERLGFVDTGRLYQGGRSGPQHVMRRTF